jgi:alpha/beta superfamily hydrolase
MAWPLPVEAPVVEAVRFSAGPYRLEGELAYLETGTPRAGLVIAGPHPLLGGSMHNNVVRGLGDGLAGRGLATLRFNYRGVGRSEGPPVDVAGCLAQFWQTSHVPGEAHLRDDLDGAAAFLREVLGEGPPLVLAGYSFGCSLLAPDRGGDAVARILIAPTLGTHDYEAFVSLQAPTLVIAPEGDFASDAPRLRAWYGRLTAPRQLIEGRLDNHFFRGYENWLVETVLDFLRSPEVIRDGSRQ